MPNNSNQHSRFTQPGRFRICDYQSIEPGELFLVPSLASSTQLALMIQVIEQHRIARIPILLSNENGAFIEPRFERLEIANVTCASLGKNFEFLVDPLEPKNRLDVTLNSISGSGFSIIDGRLVVRAQAAPKTNYRGSIYADVHAGTLVENSKLRTGTILFASWQLILAGTLSDQTPVILGTYTSAN